MLYCHLLAIHFAHMLQPHLCPQEQDAAEGAGREQPTGEQGSLDDCKGQLMTCECLPDGCTAVVCVLLAATYFLAAG